MYHITDFESTFESEKEDSPLLENPQQQCLPVGDADDYDYMQSHFTVEGRRYLQHVRREAAKFALIRAGGESNAPPVAHREDDISSATSTNTTAHDMHSRHYLHYPTWNSNDLIGAVIRNFKYTRRVIELRREQASEARGAESSGRFTIAHAVRTRQWWAQYCFGSKRGPHGPTGDREIGESWQDATAMANGNDDNADADNLNADEDEDDDYDYDDYDAQIDEEYYGAESEKLYDSDADKILLGESMIGGAVHLCVDYLDGIGDGEERSEMVERSGKISPATVAQTATRTSDAYVTGHQPQISFLCELGQIEVIRVLRFFRIWLRRDGYRQQLGLWLYALLALLDPIQTGDVFHELRVLFVACSLARIRTLLDVVSALKTIEIDSGATKSDNLRSTKMVPSACNRYTKSISSANKCNACERVNDLRKQNATLCLVMLIIGHFFGQKDLITLLPHASLNENEAQKSAQPTKSQFG